MDTENNNINLEDLIDHAEEAFSIFCTSDAGVIDLLATSSSGDNLIHAAVTRRNMTEVLFLAGRGLDINAQGDLDMTPLFLASSRGDVPMVCLLLSLGANPEIPDDMGCLPERMLFKSLGKYSAHCGFG